MPIKPQNDAVVNTDTAIDATAMHRLTPEMACLAESVLQAVLHRQGQDPWPLGGICTPDDLAGRVGQTVTASGFGAEESTCRRWR